MTAALGLAEALIACRSSTTWYGGGQSVLAARWRPLGLTCEQPEHAGTVALLITSDEEGPSLHGSKLETFRS